MLKDNSSFVQKQGIETIRQNHHNLKWHLFNRVSIPFSLIIDAQIIDLNVVFIVCDNLQPAPIDSKTRQTVL